MRKLLVLAGLACAACAQGAWLTVLGERTVPAVNTVEVDPVPVSVSEEHRTMRIRVNRSTSRTSWDGVPYRSYESEVVFDCTKKKARYASIVFYQQPVWQGKSHHTSVYTPENPRWMQFRDVSPNPTRRIIRAACETGRVTTS